MPDLVLRVVAKAGGVAPDQMVIRRAKQPPEFMAAFARHAVDGFTNSPPFIQQVVLDGTGVIVSDFAKGEPTEFSPFASALFVTRADFCAAHRSICEKMVRGIVEATRIIRNQPSETLAIMKARFGTYDDKVLRAAYEMIRATTPDPATSTAKEMENGDLMNIAAGFMKPEDTLADYGALVDNEFVK